MKANWHGQFTALLCCIAFACIVSNGQDSSEKPILAAPSSTGRTMPAHGSSSSEPHKNTNRIVGGVPSAGRPFMAALLYEKDGKLYQYCGASVVGDRWLLTAAHCEVKEGEWAVINRSNLQAVGGVKLRVEHVYTHGKYDASTHDNDISLLRVGGDIPDSIPRISIAAAPSSGTDVLTAGWGLTTENGKQSLILREVKVPIIDNGTCKASYSDLTENMICAGEKGKDSCQGDSGGPLFLDDGNVVRQIGIVSYGVGCGREGFPGVYTRVDNYQKNKWISDTMKQ
jgi:secreted trypsin-like serine protease